MVVRFPLTDWLTEEVAVRITVCAGGSSRAANERAPRCKRASHADQSR